MRSQIREIVRWSDVGHFSGGDISAGKFGATRELELYLEGELTPAEALQTASITAAWLDDAGENTGSMAVDKEGDLVLVYGEPSRRIGNMRKTVWGMSDGGLMNADELRHVPGFVGRQNWYAAFRATRKAPRNKGRNQA